MKKNIHLIVFNELKKIMFVYDIDVRFRLFTVINLGSKCRNSQNERFLKFTIISSKIMICDS
jgi:hypothetical protein